MPDIANTTEGAASFMEKAIIGACTGLFCGSLLVIYIMCLYVIGQEKQLIQKSYYMIIFNMGFSDIGQLFFQGVIGVIYCLIPYEMPYFIRRSSGSVAMAFYFSSVSFAQTMAMDRFCSIFWPEKSSSIFSVRNTKLAVCICWFHGVLWFVVFCTPQVICIFDITWYTTVYGDTAASEIAMHINDVISSIHGISIVVIYSLIYAKLKWHNNKVSHMRPNQSNVASKQNKILFQSLLLCSVDLIGAVWFYVIEFIPYSGRWSALSANTVWMLGAGKGPLIYLMFNSLIRQRFKEHFCHKVTTIETINVTPTGART